MQSILKHKGAFRVICLGTLFILGGRSCLAEPPIIFKAIEPVAPNETTLLFGGSVTAEATAEGLRLDDDDVSAPPREALHQPDSIPSPLTVLQATDLSAKVLIPAKWKPGVFAVRVKNSDGASEWQFLNRPSIWWLVAGVGGQADLGSEVRICGVNFGAKSRVWLQADQGSALELPVTEPRAYDLTVKIPPQATPGHYSIWVHNGHGGKAGFGEPAEMTIVKRAPWPQQLFDVKKFGAGGDGKSDDTKAVASALSTAQSNGGGIVFIPQGTYIITGKLVVPPHTIVRGEARDLVWLKVPSRAAPIDTVLAGNGNFTVENLSIVAQTSRRLIACPDIPASYTLPEATWDDKMPSVGGVTLHNLRLQHLPFAHRPPENDPLHWLQKGPSTVVLRGPDCEVSDCVIVSSGMALHLSNALRDRIQRNELGTGRSGWYGIWDFSYGLFEGNEIVGRDMEASYGGIEGTARFLLFRDNHWHDAYGGEREALTFDSPYFPEWVGRIRMTSPQSLELVAKSDGSWPPAPDAPSKLAAVVIAGKGLGQLVPIVSTSATGLTLASPWKIPPDENSIVALIVDKSHVIVTDNRCTDASVFPQLYAQSYSFVISHNYSERTGGSYANANYAIDQKGKQRVSYAFFNQWIDNDFVHGFVYDQGPYPIGFLGCFVNHDPKLPPSVMAIGNRFTNNRLDDQTDLGIRTFTKQPEGSSLISRDALIENNTWPTRPVKIFVDPYNAYTLIRNNGKKATQPLINDQGIQTVTIKPNN